jgi:transposase
MRGDERVQGVLFATVVLEDRIPADHPLRAIRRLVDPNLRDLSPQFAALYCQTGRPSMPTEQLPRALLLQLLYSIRSERQLVVKRHPKLPRSRHVKLPTPGVTPRVRDA